MLARPRSILDRGTYATIDNPAVKVVRVLGFKRQVRVSIRLYDTLLLAPPSHRSLAKLGDELGLQKIDLPANAIERMDLLRANKPDLFYRYAVRDAEIAALYFHKWMTFSAEVLDLPPKQAPLTLGSAAVKMFKALSPVDMDSFRGVGNDGFLPAARQANALAAECFHGGRNEAYWQGPTPAGAPLYDIDLAGAYSTCLADLRPPDWSRVAPTADPGALTALDAGMSFAHVTFRFPDDTRFPSLPVRTSAGLVYPLSGESYCTGPELLVALGAGANVVINQGVIVPWASTERPVLTFSNRVAELRASLKATGDGLSERIVKDIGNSLYGKFAQAVAGKRAGGVASRTFNTADGTFEPMEDSAITQPCFAAWTTGLCRAALSELLCGLPAGAIVASATTDGFLSDVPLDAVDVSGPVFAHFTRLREIVAPGDAAPLVVKHVVNQAYVMRTRGALTLKPAVGHPAGAAPVFARCGQRLNDAEHAALRGDDWAHNDRWVEIALTRTYDLQHARRQLICLAEQWRRDADLIDGIQDVRVSLDADHKRDYRQNPGTPDGIAGGPSAPWPTADDAERAREAFTVWRSAGRRVLLTNRDWGEYKAFRASYDPRPRTRGGGGSLLQWVRHHMANGTAGFPGPDRTRTGWNATAMADYLTGLGHPTSAQNMRDARRHVPVAVSHLTPTDKALLGALQDRFGVDFGPTPVQPL